MKMANFTCYLLRNAALRTTLEVRPSVSFSFSAGIWNIYPKKLQFAAYGQFVHGLKWNMSCLKKKNGRLLSMQTNALKLPTSLYGCASCSHLPCFMIIPYTSIGPKRLLIQNTFDYIYWKEVRGHRACSLFRFEQCMRGYICTPISVLHLVTPAIE